MKNSMKINIKYHINPLYKKPPEMEASKNTNDEKKFYIRDKNYFIY